MQEYIEKQELINYCGFDENIELARKENWGGADHHTGRHRPDEKGNTGRNHRKYSGCSRGEHEEAHV